MHPGLSSAAWNLAAVHRPLHAMRIAPTTRPGLHELAARHSHEQVYTMLTDKAKGFEREQIASAMSRSLPFRLDKVAARACVLRSGRSLQFWRLDSADQLESSCRVVSHRRVEVSVLPIHISFEAAGTSRLSRKRLEGLEFFGGPQFPQRCCPENGKGANFKSDNSLDQTLGRRAGAGTHVNGTIT